MNNSIRTICSVSLVTLFAFAPIAVNADDDTNPLVDPGFERQVPPEEGGWNPVNISGFSPDVSRSGQWSMFNGGFNAVVSPSFQFLPAKPGSQWQLTGYGLTFFQIIGSPAFGIVQFSFFDDDLNDLGTVETAGQQFPAKTSNEVNGQSPVMEWIFLDTGIATAPEGTTQIGVFTLFVDFSFSNTFQGVFFDDLELCLVEEEDDDEIECQEFDDDDDDSDSDSDSDSDDD